VAANTRMLPDTDIEDSSTVELTTWSAPGLDEVRHYRIVGGGHTVPSRIASMPAFLLGPTNADIEAAEEIWAFFQGVPDERPRPAVSERSCAQRLSARGKAICGDSHWSTVFSPL